MLVSSDTTHPSGSIPPINLAQDTLVPGDRFHCSPDIYIAMHAAAEQNLNQMHFAQSETPEKPPYYTLNSATVEKFYQQVGAGRVSIRTLKDADFTQTLANRAVYLTREGRREEG